MKPIFIILIFMAIAFGANAQKSDRGNDLGKGMGDKYVKDYSKDACLCVVTEDNGRLTVQQSGKAINGEVKLASAKITSAGTLKKDNGAERMLVNGNCVSEKATITMRVK